MPDAIPERNCQGPRCRALSTRPRGVQRSREQGPVHTGEQARSQTTKPNRQQPTKPHRRQQLGALWGEAHLLQEKPPGSTLPGPGGGTAAPGHQRTRRCPPLGAAAAAGCACSGAAAGAGMQGGGRAHHRAANGMSCLSRPSSIKCGQQFSLQFMRRHCQRPSRCGTLGKAAHSKRPAAPAAPAPGRAPP